MKTDYTTLTKQHFIDTVRKYLSYEVLYNKVDLNSTNKIFPPMALDITEWRDFKIGGSDGIFIISPCKCSNAGNLEDADIDFFTDMKALLDAMNQN